MVGEVCETRFACPFGSDAFLALIKAQPGTIDVLCHHGAEVGDYRSPDFDPYRAAATNLYRLPEVLRALDQRGCGRLVLTGSVFEAGEGAGSAPLRAFSPYGLSKTLTSAAAEYYAGREGFTFEKFVIPNPFGPYEEPRFTAYLMRTWLAGESLACRRRAMSATTSRSISSPRPMPALSAQTRRRGPCAGSIPSGYPESQGAFAQRLRREAATRLGLPAR